MTDESAPMNLSIIRDSLPRLSQALKDFQSSSSTISILRNINPPTSPSSSPRTLFILDSSFNPPSRAHLALASSVLTSPSSPYRYAQPWHLLLLFSTHNADKAPSPASFTQRIALMEIFARDLLSHLKQLNASTTIPIDVAVTKKPYYTDKSTSIMESALYPSQPQHVHLCGFDTLTRIFEPKYYKSFDPPLSALEPYFDAGHRLRVMQRPDGEYGTAEEQREYLEGLAEGRMEEQGGKREWAEKVEMVEGEEGIGVSSTRVRRAAKGGDWKEVRRLCTEGVAEWVIGERLYEEDASGAKMA
ncbi:MAG: hypothetical protein M1820_000313 [Bogoriella megaspora]|nr:MAG: hypothetical protein M1820_000313 [Bogoriella megaspora]